MNAHRRLFPDCACEDCRPRRWWCDDCHRPFPGVYELIRHRNDDHLQKETG